MCNFKFFFIFILECSTLSVELNFVIIAVFLAKLANLSRSIMAYVVIARYFCKIKFKKQPTLKHEELRNGECLNLKNF